MVREGGAIDNDQRQGIANPRRKEWLAISFELRVKMTAEQDLNWKIHNVRESIGLDLANLASKNLTADRQSGNTLIFVTAL